MKFNLLILFSVFLFSFAKAETSSTYMFRVSQQQNASPGDYGHCTAMYDDISKEIYTAAHCYHFKPLNLRGANGELIIDLTQASYNFLKNDIGLLDILVISNFNEELLELAKRKAKVSIPSEGITIIGFPAKYNTENTSKFYCSERPISPGLGPRAIEASLNTLHLNCETYTVGDSAKISNNLDYKDIAGLSGGAVFDNGKYVGVAYHYEVNDQVEPYFFKVQLFNQNDRPISVDQARRNYQLDTKLFEEAKLPNSVTSKLFLLLMVDYALSVKDINNLERAYWQDNNKLVLVTQEGKKLEVPRRKLTSSLLAYFQQLL